MFPFYLNDNVEISKVHVRGYRTGLICSTERTEMTFCPIDQATNYYSPDVSSKESLNYMLWEYIQIQLCLNCKHKLTMYKIVTIDKILTGSVTV